MPNGKTFIRITNKDIYEKLEEVEKHVLKTNGQVQVNKWVGRTALGLVVAVFGALFGIAKFV